MPVVKPSTTGNGTISMARPMALSPIRITITPAITASSGTCWTPCWAITGSNTTVIAPVGPEICRWLPPNTAATMPATTAVIRPAAAPTPDATPKPSASGNATMPTVTPASRSRAQLWRNSA